MAQLQTAPLIPKNLKEYLNQNHYYETNKKHYLDGTHPPANSLDGIGAVNPIYP
jgi:hypothetical protein